MGENGLFNRARFAKEKYQNEESKENKALLNYEDIIAQYVGSSRQVGEMTTQELTEFVEAIVETKTQNLTSKDLTPTGAILAQMGKTAPTGYVICNGATYNIDDEAYNALAEYIKAQFGTYNYFGGDGTTTFAVPNLQGEFLRGAGTNGHTNQGAGAVVGTHQDATLHPHTIAYRAKDGSYAYIAIGYTTTNYSDSSTNYQIATNFDRRFDRISSIRTSATWTGNAAEGWGLYTSRPTNTSVLYCIKL